jgi:hypothetical protein
MTETKAPVQLHPVGNSLQCATQGFTTEDCSSALVSDGFYWRCPYNHIQGFDQAGKPIRKIADRRPSVRKGHLNRDVL